ncbi:phage integrase family protein [Paenibacillus larvae subsp. larvae]|uniref:Phage integrase family protein n=1 Tax=Paenibacillus larvae subsp. larvae TaxID=147375 RepID=A0A2L1UH17_9BACL|nr:tyrosine-type recombinase/integrase [Paenibacillus larvae]AQZ46086.1 integrase [Paenibacillus larvae subsp. pulvifaciens]AVF27736.1 phage integrase family protein [Paenibacillus larvae subsp. larvae]AVF32239.1 phage integrase family protein [Paenibacillus larvae subsp. larvae]MCY9502658.1 tyrosine-type recombinase/integrase [Paenibacillus larvae]MCY9678599.1 tyrosine-type recombinase/integrase [Paenibacillus larvae]
MRERYGISKQGKQIIQDFIHSLTTHEDLNPKTLKEYASDLKHFIGWFETANYQEENIVFRIEDVATPTLTRYREASQKVMELKPATINRRLITLKRFFEWAASNSMIRRDPSKPVKLVPEEKVSPRQMTDKEEDALIAAAEHGGSLRDQTILIVMLHTGLRTMEVCDLAPGDIQIGKLTVRSGKRNKQREVPLNATCRSALEKYLVYLPPGSPYLFPSEKTGDRLSERALRHLIQKYMKKARLKGLSAHDLRHRFGYVMAENTPLHRLAQIMGHDSLDTTMIYVKATRSDLQSEVEKIAWQ